MGNANGSGRSPIDRLDTDPVAWTHAPGDRPAGIVVDLETGVSEHAQEPYPLVTVLAKDGSSEEGGSLIPTGEERVFHAFHTVSRNELLSPVSRWCQCPVGHGSDPGKGSINSCSRRRVSS